MEDNFEELGQLIDEMDTLTYSLQLPLSADIHVQMIKEILPEKVKRFKEVFIKISGENPWE